MSTPGVFEALRCLVQEYPSASIGVGTVLDRRDAKVALDLGAKFLMSPAMVKGILDDVVEGQALYIPGAATPTEILSASNDGAKIIKVYPVSALGGVEYLSAVKKPFPHIPLVASQGMTLDSVGVYIGEGASAVVLSDAIFDKKAMAERNFFLIYKLACSAATKGNQALRKARLMESNGSEEKCNLFIGDWVYQAEPHYTNSSCSFIEDHQNCMKNGRPDSDYLYWRWKPRDCELGRLDPARFLELMRNKSWAFIGDSISRNHVHSILCGLSMVEMPIEVYHDETYKSRRWHFPLHNFTLSAVWSPFLTYAATFEDNNGVSTSDIQLHLDILDKNWTEQYRSHDYVMLSVGKWFTKTAIYYENNTVLGCYNCTNSDLTKLRFNFAYRRAMRTVFDYIIASNHEGVTFYRTSSPDHFEGGEWFSGGTCKRKAPVKEGGFELNKPDRLLRDVEVEELEKILAKASEKGVKLRLFDVHLMSLLRPDGHPGPYRFYQPFAEDEKAKVINDCLHWCLPGPIDSWNDVLMEMIVKG